MINSVIAPQHMIYIYYHTFWNVSSWRYLTTREGDSEQQLRRGCRDSGRGRVDEGVLCLSSLPHDSVGVSWRLLEYRPLHVKQIQAHLTRARTSTRLPHPLVPNEHYRSKPVIPCHSERSEESLWSKRDSSLRSEWHARSWLEMFIRSEQIS